jgi:DNA polymerase
MICLHLDFETRSTVDIREQGLDVYARNAEVLMLAWALNDQAPQIWLPHETPIPENLALLLERKEIVKVAWNSAFERAIFWHTWGINIPLTSWLDPSCMARYAGLPSSLADVGEALGLPQDEAKDKDGKRLIQKFCKPKKDGTYKDWNTDPEDWARFCDYCKQDVIAERNILRKLEKGFMLPPRERKIWLLDQQINERGIPVDMTFVHNAKVIVDAERSRLMDELGKLTNLENPNSTKQMLGFLKENGYPYESLKQKMVKEALA